MEQNIACKAEALSHNQLPGSLELAYLGDTVYDFYVRMALVRSGGRIRDLHRKAIDQVCAHAQAEALTRVEAMLTEEEKAVVRRARNAKQNPPRRADPAEYHRATALEALVGYLSLLGRTARLDEIMHAALEQDGKQG